MKLRCLVLSLVLMSTVAGSIASAAELYVGCPTVSITPDKPVALDEHRRPRITKDVASPLTATALALESRTGDKSLEAAIFVSVDLVAIRDGLSELVRKRLEGRVPGFDLNKLILSATHPHNAPVTIVNNYDLPKEGIIQPAEYVEFLVERLAKICVQAW